MQNKTPDVPPKARAKEKGVLRIDPSEWKAVKGAVDKEKESGSLKPFLILSKEQLQNQYPESKELFNHDVIVIRIGRYPPDYLIGIMSDEVEVNPDSVRAISGGALREGDFGKVRIVQWDDQETGVIEIQRASTELEDLKLEDLEKGLSIDLGEDERRDEELRVLMELGVLRVFPITQGSSKYIIQKGYLGSTMYDYFEGTKAEQMPLAQRCEAGLKAALAIRKLHAKNIIHCDIKSKSFTMNWAGDAAVVAPIGFIFSKQLKEGEKEKVVDFGFGTPGYMAPEIEQAFVRDKEGKLTGTTDDIPAHNARYSKASDVYALGVMFRDDLKLGKPGNPKSPLENLIRRMTSEKPSDRPTMDEVIRTMQVAQALLYMSDYTVQKKHSWFSKGQAGMSQKLSEILGSYQEVCETVLEEEQRTKEADSIANQIVKEVQENQKRHEKKTFFTASSFNLKTLKLLPDELRRAVCQKLGLDKDSKILTENVSYKTRKELAGIISKSIKELPIPALESKSATEPAFKR